ncbi:uncharacterized protein LOC129590147 [Paramacrobiotus metropolitanus]|uniref:uncharacterized protein LOC129590147 n=1 Tax=Paramacrobiotus metropolitanus TaxID=2943436 RepID=UPI00244588D8|nr:uncharacterized protein LOC129590147 [Paramacrobiotus metropolitanus]
MGTRFSKSASPYILNQPKTVTASPTSDSEAATTASNILLLAERLEQCMRRLQGCFLSADGKAMDYLGMKNSPQFVEFVNCAVELQQASLTPLSGVSNESLRKAFFINIYNLMTMHALIELSARDTGIPRSMLDVKDFWRSFEYKIGGLTFSLDDIEHGILRGNRPHPRDLWSRCYFNAKDERVPLALSQCDPRIHFCLNCGAQACPRVSVYSGTDTGSLESALNGAAKAFCAENIVLDGTRNEIHLSKIFQWYEQDFGSDRTGMLARVSGWLNDDKEVQLRALMSKEAKVIFVPYDWRVNSTSQAGA